MHGWVDGQTGGWKMGRLWMTQDVPEVPHLPAEVHLVEQLDAQQDADLVELLGHIQVLLQVPLHQGVQHPPVHQVVVEGLGVL